MRAPLSFWAQGGIMSLGMARPKKEELRFVAFKVGDSLYRELEEIAKGEIQESGKALTVPLLCRRYVVEGVRRGKPPRKS